MEWILGLGRRKQGTGEDSRIMINNRIKGKRKDYWRCMGKRDK